jgi:NAD(P)-dependent dehydrogenase (short-subunit alcohol dehydrogenase family)
MLGATGLPLTSAYCASKFALEGWTEALRHELRPHGVRVALVQPGGHRTRFAENAVWGEGVARADSPYTRQSAGYRHLKARLTSRPGVGPEAVARVIARLAGADRLPLRVRVGRDARLLHAVHRLLPERLAVGLIAATIDRIFREPPRDGDRAPRHVAEPPWI